MEYLAAWLGISCLPTEQHTAQVAPTAGDAREGETPPPTGPSAGSGEEGIAPPTQVVMPTAPPPRDQMAHSSQMKEDTVREALLSMVAEHCCYGKSAAKTMTLDKYTPHVAHHTLQQSLCQRDPSSGPPLIRQTTQWPMCQKQPQYILETFTEVRTTHYRHRPHRGGHVDGPNCGTPPKPWEMKNYRIPDHFTDHTEHSHVPHTEEAKTCYNCKGSGDVRCTTCSGKGDIRCSHCSGQGTTRQRDGDHWKDVKCSVCLGKGYNRCHSCMGKGFITCPECCGAKMLIHFLELHINWRTYTDDVVQQVTTLPDHLVKNVSGDIVFQEEDSAVYPVSHCPEETVNISSTQLLQKHRTCLKTHRQQRQRHKLRVVPNTEVDAEFKKKKHTFYIYGLENKVHFPTYPQKCCWGCTIM